MTPPPNAPDFQETQENQRVSSSIALTEPNEALTFEPLVDPRPSRRSPTSLFVIGAMIGGIAGAIVGTALSPYTRGLIVGLYHLINRRLSSSERDQLRFELLLQ